jgi:hypothetical protein
MHAGKSKQNLGPGVLKLAKKTVNPSGNFLTKYHQHLNQKMLLQQLQVYQDCLVYIQTI